MEGAMSDASPLAGQRPVWLDDKTKSIMDRAIAREQSLSRMLMTYIITGLVWLMRLVVRLLTEMLEVRILSGEPAFALLIARSWEFLLSWGGDKVQVTQWSSGRELWTNGRLS
jgi:hypothetical protein